MISDLKAQIASHRAVVLVGTGVSWAASSSPTAGWKGFLAAGIDACVAILGALLPHRWAERQREALELGDLDELLSVAETVSRKLGAPRGGEFRRWLRETVGALQVKQRGVLEAIDTLQAPVVTTNYDSLLENVTGRRPITWRQDNQVTRFIADDQQLQQIFHVHGHWEDSESIVLGVRSYDTLAGHDHAQSALRTLLMTRTALLVGYGDGLEDPNFGALRTWATSVLGGTEHRHYRLCLTSEVEKISRTHYGERIVPLDYGNSYDDLGPFLRSLSPHGTGSGSGGRNSRTKAAASKPTSRRTAGIRSKPARRAVILFTAANPRGAGPLQLDEESASILQQLTISPHRDDFIFESRWVVGVDDFMRHLTELDPTVIHFSGYGDPLALLLEDKDGKPQPASGRALAMMIETAAPSARLVVLNACYSAALADALRDKIDCIVGMDGAISDAAARAFAVEFYRALGHRRSVGHAVAYARAALATRQLADHALPRCMTREGVDADQLVLPRS